MKHLIIFDCFGVICSEIAPIWLGKHFAGNLAVEIKERYFTDADRGLVDLDTLIHNMALDLGFREEDIRREWAEIFTLNVDLVEYIKSLKGKHYLALLSNAPKGLVEKIFAHYSLDVLFDHIFISSHYRMAKPDPCFYRLCVDAFNKDYEKVIMIDDNLRNLQGLESLSIVPVHYSTNEQLYSEMEELLT